ncbi:MAG: lytic murein transglycosylase, partial [Acidimicrobiales bacterium]
AAHRRLDREQRLLTEAAERETEAQATLTALEPQLAPTERRFEQWLLTQRVPGFEDLTIVAVDAYYNASRLAFQRWPGCRISWNQLAGVGRVESFHGRFGRSQLMASGATSAKILGPQLNGDPWQAIPDTDQGVLDDDIEWDRAVGPMQFIPTSWAIFAADGNNDGYKDPHNLYDAALAAADHLCGEGLDSVDRFRTALLGYNRSVKYGYDVIRFSETYATAGEIVNPWNVERDSSAGATD